MSNENRNSSGRQYSKPAPPPLDPGRRWFHGATEKSSDEFGGPENDYEYRSGPKMTAATGIDPGKEENIDPFEKRRYEELHRYNDFRHEADRANDDLPERQHAWDMQRIPEAITSQLPISERQRGKVVEAVHRLDFSKFGQQKGLERVTLGVAAVIVMDEREKLLKRGSEPTKEPPEDFWLTRTDEFKQIRKAHDITMSDLSTVKDIVREELDGRTYDPSHIGPLRDPHLPKMTVADRPDEYWEEVHPNYWHSVARLWEQHSEEYEEALPDEYLELVERLRHWEPWEMDYPALRESQPEIPDSNAEIDLPQDDVSIEDLDELEEAVESELSEEVEAEAEALLDEMSAEDTE